MTLACIFCDDFEASKPDGTCEHCESLPDAPRDERGGEPEREPRTSIVYRITERSTGRIYVGVHATDDPEDGYMGSGEAIRAAIAEARARNAVEVEFRKDVLLVLGSGAAALEVERGLVGPEQVASPRYFNLCLGGGGGLGLSEESRAKHRDAVTAAQRRPDARKKKSADMKRLLAEDPAAVERLRAMQVAARAPAGRAKNSDAKKRLYAGMTDEERRAMTEAARTAAHTPDGDEKRRAAVRTPQARAKNSDAKKRLYAGMTADDRRAATDAARATKRQTKLRRQALDSLACAHGLADVVEQLRAKQKAEQGRKVVERRRRAQAERERVRREVGVILAALIVSKYGGAEAAP